MGSAESHVIPPALPANLCVPPSAGGRALGGSGRAQNEARVGFHGLKMRCPHPQSKDTCVNLLFRVVGYATHTPKRHCARSLCFRFLLGVWLVCRFPLISPDLGL